MCIVRSRRYVLVRIVDDDLSLLLLLIHQVHCHLDLWKGYLLLFDYERRHNPLAGFKVVADLFLELCHLVVCEHHGTDTVEEVQVLLLFPDHDQQVLSVVILLPLDVL